MLINKNKPNSPRQSKHVGESGIICKFDCTGRCIKIFSMFSAAMLADLCSSVTNDNNPQLQQLARPTWENR